MWLSREVARISKLGIPTTHTNLVCEARSRKSVEIVRHSSQASETRTDSRLQIL
jgi:hypothetical protein